MARLDHAPDRRRTNPSRTTRAVGFAAILLAVLLAPSLALAADGDAWAPVEGLAFNKDGTIKVGFAKLGVLHFDGAWACTTKVTPDAGQPQVNADSWSLTGALGSPSGELRIAERADKAAPDTLRVTVEVTAATAVATNSLSVCISLDLEHFSGVALSLDGTPCVLPAEYKDMGVLSKSGVQRLVIPQAGGIGRLELEGPFDVYIQDNRKFGGETYEVRLGMTPGQGQITKSSLAFNLRVAPFAAEPISIAAACNMGFRDETDGDQQGGWTDQGQNDLRMMKPGQTRLGGILFDILDPAQNGGKSCLVFAGPQREYFVKTAAVASPGKAYEQLYLLHAIAWAPQQKDVPIGTITVTYADGSSGTIQVLNARDVGNWWAPDANRPNGLIAWTGENPESFVGLFLSKFALERKPLKELRFDVTGAAVWMVVGVSAGEDAPLCVKETSYIVANERWKPVKHTWAIKAGSAFDFSSLVETPAGKDGRVVVRNGHFELENRPGVKTRFVGANLCYTANYLEKADCERLAENLRRMGYNTIRFHHYDRDLPNPKSSGTTEPDPVQLDKLEYLFHCLKKNGMYITIDLYTDRYLKKGEIAGFDRTVRHDFKQLVPVHAPAMENWKTFARNLLTHRNPYTGLTWAEDPALFTICGLNEDNFFVNGLKGEYDDVRQLYEARLDAQLASQGRTGLTPEEHAAELDNLGMQIQLEGIRAMHEYLRSLGYQGLFTDLNMCNHYGNYPQRDELDFVDNHSYWDHPRFLEKAWSLPSALSQRSSVAAGSYPAGLAPTRIFGRPFGVTEINFCVPNHCRAESGPVTGAFAALQDWDGVWRFAFTHTSKTITGEPVPSTFDIAGDPLNLLSERLVPLLFLRGDAKSATTAIPIVYTSDALKMPCARKGPPSAYTTLGYYARLGSVRGDCRAHADCAHIADLLAGQGAKTEGGGFWHHLAFWQRRGGPGAAAGASEFAAFLNSDSPGRVASSAVPLFDLDSKTLAADLAAAGIIDPAKVDLVAKRVVSETGEIVHDEGQGTLTVATPRTECFVLPGKVSLSGAAVTAANTDPDFAVVAVSSLDGKPVAESARLLVLHMTDVQNTKVKFGNRKHTVIEHAGTLPRLARNGSATITLKTANAATLKAWALDIDGTRLAPVTLRNDAGALTLDAKVFQPAGPCMAYELATE
ncbi:MAG: hypothetical protein A3K19_09055 [Lentisphaerae bacterium RIFOXYB12_FULL_65_16]|nr:MAG: hypothetical protein A3K18_14080 [Lentisphaerae bacterium RIFOXYA12_64_32]OGV93247.1 MAG: hypothetical protein A3K19_09055 [Lentisphaerae bacterium RIFOXYB12_FULL_65_16]